MKSRRSAERLTLTLPGEPRLSRLVRLVVLHFLRHHGVSAAVARRGARSVQGRCEPWLRALAGRGALAVVLTLGARAVTVEGVSRAPRARRPLYRCPRPLSS